MSTSEPIAPTEHAARICVYFSWPESPDLEHLHEVLGEAHALVDVVAGPTYRETTGVRTLKRSKRATRQICEQEPVLTPAHLDAYARADVVVAVDVPFRLTEIAPRLRWVQSCGAGVGQFNEPELAARGVLLTTGAGLGAVPIAEFVIGRLLQVFKDFRGLDRLQADQRWEFHPGRMLADRTMLILGLGAIGSAVAQRARAFGVRTIGIRRTQSPESAALVDELRSPDELDTLLGKVDIVVASLPDTPETYHLFDSRRFALMRQDAVFCNVGRGTLVEERVLVDALRTGRPAAVVLDVTEVEPLPRESPLWSFENVFISPHSSVSEDGYERRLADLVGRNILRFLGREPLLNTVDYRTVRQTG